MPADRGVGFFDGNHATEDHSDGADQQAKRKHEIGKQDQRDRNGEEQERPADLLGPDVLVRKFGCHHDEVAIRLKSHQRLPWRVADQRVAGRKRHGAKVRAVLGDCVSAAVDDQRGEPVDLAEPELPHALADNPGSRRDHDFGNAGLARVERFRKGLEFRSFGKLERVLEIRYVPGVGNYGELGRRLDEDIPWRGGVGPALECRRNDLDIEGALEVAQRVAGEKASVRHVDFVDDAVKPVGRVEILKRRLRRAGIVAGAARQHELAEQDEVEEAGRHQRNSDRRDGKEGVGVHAGAFSKRLVYGNEQVVQKDQR